MAADGTLYIETAIETDGFVAGGKDVEAAAKRMAQTVSGIGSSAKIALKKQAEAFVQMNQKYAQQQKKVEDLKNKLKELENVKVETQKYQKLGKELNDLEAQFESVEQKQKEWQQMGFPIDSAPFKELEKQLNDIWSAMEKVQRKQRQMKSDGSAYVNPKATVKYQGTEARIAVEEQKLVNMNNKLGNSYESLKQKVAGYGGSNSKLISIKKRLQKALAIVGASLKGMGTALKKVGSSLKSMVSSLKRAISSMTGFRKETDRGRMSLSKMLGMSLLFSTVFRAISGVSNGIKEGMQNLAQYSDKTNASLSLLMSSLTRLKNSFATAFAPILSVVAPIMSSFIDMLSRGVTYVGMFFASLTGQDTFTRAKAVQWDYAASLDKTSKSSKKAAKATKDAAKAAKGSLAPWDELTVIQRNLSDSLDDTPDIAVPGVSTDLAPQDMFEDVPIKSSIKNFANRMKKLIKTQDWNGIGKLLGQQINKGLRKLNKTIKWDAVGDDITKGVDAITGIFNSLVDEIDWEYTGNTAGEGLNTFFKTLNQLMEKIDWKNLGKGFAEFANGLMDAVEWDEVGSFIGNKIMLLWDTVNGVVHELHWADIGISAGEALNAAFARISFTDIADTLATGVNGAFKALVGFTKTFDWEEFTKNVRNGISTFLEKTNWEENGAALGDFILNLLTTLKNSMTIEDFRELGRSIGNFLSALPWTEILKTAAEIIVGVLGGLMSGLAETPAGMLVDALVIAFTGATIISKLKGAFSALFGSAAAGGAAQAAGKIAKSVGWLKFLSAIGIGVSAGMSLSEVTVEDPKKDGSFAETEAMLKDFGIVLEDLSAKGTMSKETLNGLKEAMQLISADTIPMDVLTILAQALADAGVSSDDLAISVADTQTNLVDLYNVLSNSYDIVGSATEKTKTFDEAVSSVRTSSLIDQMNSLQSAVDQLSFAQMILESTNAIDEMGGIWENGKQILGEKAIAIHEEITKNGLNPDKDGFYKLANGQMVQYGQGIEDSEGVLKEKTQETLDSALYYGIEAVLPKQMSMGWNTGGYFIDGYVSAFIDKKPEIESAFTNALKNIDTGEAKKQAKQSGKEVGSNIGKGLLSGINSSKESVNKSILDLIDDDIKAPTKKSLQIGSPSKVFAGFAKFCGDGFTNALPTAFSQTFRFFQNFGKDISDSIGDLTWIGYNTIIGVNNGMIAGSSVLYANARTIANNIERIFREALKIHSPSKVMEKIGSYTMDGLQNSMQNGMDKIAHLIYMFSDSIQEALDFQVPAISTTIYPSMGAFTYPKVMPVMAQGVVIPPQTATYINTKGSNSTDETEESIKRAFIAALKESNDSADIVSALREALEGMAVYADDQIIGYLKEKNLEHKNRSGHGLFEGR